MVFNISFRDLNFEEMKQQFVDLGTNLLYTVVSNPHTGPNIVKGYIHLASSFMKAREGNSSKWK